MVPTERVLYAIVLCLCEFRALVEWCLSVTEHTTGVRLYSLVEGKYLRARMSYLCIKIVSYL